ncbi:alpha/beta fold hydrolase [Couchioplanes caeruleus]|uniref:Alpha/beta hydrolase n=2 Tax=Couchioplanes caeruleus TaxID=56438 RepID=A0A1K0GS95_9ACTN|nr:alpha/beta hydrolase [Couchioplanes caeruleus]OJF15318.1 alpha/beta hydrolase [Couchioplanes caeruleus subsp. caeruleus]ROP29454.1 pimeloyl-ACP methyl ester carboxylesterase [Couchioplanes caeruleus]
MLERSEFTLADGVRLHVETSGPADAPVTVVFLHGWCLDRRTWHYQIRALEGTNTRVISYDARGHGRSSTTRRCSATLRQLGDDLAEVIDAYAPAGPVVLAGHSLGGMTIMEYADSYPQEFAERIAGLLFVSTTAEGATHTCYGLPTPLTPFLRAAEQTGAGLLARLGAWRPHRAVLPALRPGVRWLLFGDEHEPGDLALTMSAVGRASLRSIGGFRASVGAQQRLHTLAALGDVPAAALVGDKDRLTPPACAESIAEALTGTELTVCEGAGHMLMMERPAEVTAALTAVVAKAARSTRAQRRGRGIRARREGYDQAA